jgi:hypothetical protein
MTSLEHDGLDGNAIAGLLMDVFGAEMTMAMCECESCRSRRPLAETEVFLRCPGTVVRCRSCGAVLMVLVTRVETRCVDLRGLTRLDR